MVSVDTVETVLPLAEEYQMTTLTRQCESFLLSVDPSVRSLVLAERYQLIKLKPKCINHMKFKIHVRDLKEDPEFKNVSSETLLDILLETCVKYESALDGIKHRTKLSADRDMFYVHIGDHYDSSCSTCQRKVYSRISDYTNKLP